MYKYSDSSTNIPLVSYCISFVFVVRVSGKNICVVDRIISGYHLLISFGTEIVGLV